MHRLDHDGFDDDDESEEVMALALAGGGKKSKRLLSRKRLRHLVEQVAPDERIEEDVETVRSC